MRTKITAIAVVGALLLTACGSAVEEITENAIENDLGEDVELDLDDGQVNIESDEGSLSIGGGEVPEGFGIALPDGGEVVTSMDSTSGDAVMQAVSLQYDPGTYEELVEFYTDWVGDMESNKQETSGDQRSTFWAIPEHPDFGQVTISILDMPEGPLVTVSSER